MSEGRPRPDAAPRRPFRWPRSLTPTSRSPTTTRPPRSAPSRARWRPRCRRRARARRPARVLRRPGSRPARRRASAAADRACSPTMSDTTVAAPPPFAAPRHARPTWGLAEGDAIAPGRTVLQRIGGGRRYEALLVWDEHRLAVLVAKLLRPDHARDPAARRELEREARAAGAARAPRPGARLRRHGRRALPAAACSSTSRARRSTRCWSARARSRSSSCCRSACTSPRALHYLANEGVVHLDVKPSQRRDGRAAAADRPQRRPHPRGGARIRVPIGTDAFMAPEQCVPEGGAGPASDVFGLAATLYTGHRPPSVGAGLRAPPAAHARAGAPPAPRATRARRPARRQPRPASPPNRPSARSSRPRSSRWSPLSKRRGPRAPSAPSARSVNGFSRKAASRRSSPWRYTASSE